MLFSKPYDTTSEVSWKELIQSGLTAPGQV